MHIQDALRRITESLIAARVGLLALGHMVQPEDGVHPDAHPLQIISLIDRFLGEGKAERRHGADPVSDLDRSLTLKLNTERHVTIQLPQ